MITLIVFLLASVGVTFIANKSKLFLPIRVFISDNYAKSSNKKSKGRFLFMWKWLESILSCPMCFAPYAGIICILSVIYLPIWVLYPFSAVPVVTLIIQYYEKQNKK
jgi:hypothetical protein